MQEVSGSRAIGSPSAGMIPAGIYQDMLGCSWA